MMVSNTCVTIRTHIGGETEADHGGGRHRRREDEGELSQAGGPTGTDRILGYKDRGRIRMRDGSVNC